MQFPLSLQHHFNRLVLGLLISGFMTAMGVLQAGAKSTPTVLILGDSLSAEYGLARGTGWVQVMAKQAELEKINVQWVNASISGDTTSGGLSRLPALLLQHKPHLVVIELGGNDALRGLNLNMTQQNIKRMTDAAKKSGAQVLLIAMQVPPNYGDKYRQQMEAVYQKVAKETSAQINSQFLKGVADDADALKWFQADKIHPNEGAQRLMMRNVWPQIKTILNSASIKDERGLSPIKG